MDQELLTIKDIARRLDIAESTIKYYRDKFPEYMPAVKVGRYPKYRPEALEIFQVIAEGYRNNLQQQDIAEKLRAEFAINVEENDTNLVAATAAATSQQQAEKYLSLLENYATLLQQQQKTIYQQSELIKQLTEQFDREQRIKEKLLLQEMKNRENKAAARLPWWRKIFSKKL